MKGLINAAVGFLPLGFRRCLHIAVSDSGYGYDPGAGGVAAQSCDSLDPFGAWQQYIRHGDINEAVVE